MNLPRQPFVGLGLVAALGIAIADFSPVPEFQWPIWALGFLVIAPVLFWEPQIVVTYAFVAIGFFLLHNFRTHDTDGLRLAAELTERPRIVNAIGCVSSEPKIGSNGFATFLFKLQSIEFEGATRSTTASLLARWRGNPEFGDELKLFGIAEPITPPRNPGEFDMGSYLARQDVRRRLFVRYAEDGELIRKGAGNPILFAAQKSRAWMQHVICRGLDDSPQVQNFLSGIALGLRHQTPEDIEEPFQQTGTLHLFAVAGLHVGIVAQLLWILATVVRLSRKWATAVIIPLLLFYAASTGLHVSSVRAALMGSILLAGFFFERKVFVFNSLAAAAFLLLCWDTNELFSTGLSAFIRSSRRDYPACRSTLELAATARRHRSLSAKKPNRHAAPCRGHGIQLCLSGCFDFAGGLGWVVAADLLVFSFGYAELALREPARRADRVLYPGGRTVVACDRAVALGTLIIFQQRELVAG